MSFDLYFLRNLNAFDPSTVLGNIILKGNETRYLLELLCYQI